MYFCIKEFLQKYIKPLLIYVLALCMPLTYDVKKERVAKACKICRKYLHHVHKSVVEGLITEKKLLQLQWNIVFCINGEEDSLLNNAIDRIAFIKRAEDLPARIPWDPSRRQSNLAHSIRMRTHFAWCCTARLR